MLPETVTKPVELFTRDAQKNGKLFGVKALRSSASTLNATARYLEQLASKWESAEPAAQKTGEQVDGETAEAAAPDASVAAAEVEPAEEPEAAEAEQAAE